MRVLMIGCGNMGGALLQRWAGSDRVRFTVIDPVSRFSHANVTLHSDAAALADQSFDLLVVAVKPQLIDQIIPDHLVRLTQDAAILSIAAGYSADRLSALTGGRPVIRIMPNIPASVGKGVSGLYATPDVPEHTLQVVEAMMAATGELVRVDQEDGLDRVTAIAGSGPGYVFEMARTYVEAAKALGFDAETSRRLVLGTLAGAVDMALQSGSDLADLRNSVTSKAGTTEAGLRALNENGQLSDLMKATTQAAYARAVELR